MDLEELTPKVRVLHSEPALLVLDRGDRGGELSFAFQEQGPVTQATPASGWCFGHVTSPDPDDREARVTLAAGCDTLPPPPVGDRSEVGTHPRLP
jgi:hypothetical protein